VAGGGSVTLRDRRAVSAERGRKHFALDSSQSRKHRRRLTGIPHSGYERTRVHWLRSLPGLNPRVVQAIEYLLESVLIFDKLLLRRLSHLGLVIVDPITKLPKGA